MTLPPPIPFDSLSSIVRRWLFRDVLIALEENSVRLARIEAMFAIMQQQELNAMAAIDDLQTSVTKENTVIDGAVTLLSQLSQMITAAGTDPVKLASLTQQIDAKTQTLAAAILANTPAAAATA